MTRLRRVAAMGSARLSVSGLTYQRIRDQKAARCPLLLTGLARPQALVLATSLSGDPAAGFCGDACWRSPGSGRLRRWAAAGDAGRRCGPLWRCRGPVVASRPD